MFVCCEQELTRFIHIWITKSFINFKHSFDASLHAIVHEFISILPFQFFRHPLRVSVLLIVYEFWKSMQNVIYFQENFN